jgi:hypothetical protein
MTRRSLRRREPVGNAIFMLIKDSMLILYTTEEKAKKDMAAKAGGKGPLNTGAQGIKKSGKK